ncbi:MAG: 5'-methylthioadenosine/S-adenosylhomocysteine nucleosidase [Oscillospiraceae bacterium]|jgi:adenosylhomocysteine nucleosidase|nr:5'-methylthioadenosine/S-adenosylhomocysteine nucleosidase [Oscillospiraceae bacterium]
MKIGILFADDNEYTPFAQWAIGLGAREGVRHGRNSVTLAQEGNTLIAVQCGIGKVNAATAAADLIFSEGVGALLNAGLSGAVSGVRRGDIVAGSSYVECDFDITPAGRNPGEKPGQQYVYAAHEDLLAKALTLSGVKRGAFGTGDFFLTDRAKSAFYQTTFGICAFDMESAAIASVCHFTNTPFLSIRKMSDNADDTAVADYREMDALQEQDLTRLVVALAGRLA